MLWFFLHLVILLTQFPSTQPIVFVHPTKPFQAPAMEVRLFVIVAIFVTLLPPYHVHVATRPLRCAALCPPYSFIPIILEAAKGPSLSKVRKIGARANYIFYYNSMRQKNNGQKSTAMCKQERNPTRQLSQESDAASKKALQLQQRERIKGRQ